MKLRFLEDHNLDETAIRLVQGQVGVYCIYLGETRISYPFRPSRLIYIGMSESVQNSIGSRLRAHLTGQSGNPAIANYVRSQTVLFTYHPREILSVLGTRNVLEIESFFLDDFLSEHGAYPLCNNQSGVAFPGTKLNDREIEVQWAHFA